MIRRYGSEMALSKNGENRSIRAFLQDTRSKSQENAQREFSPLGECYQGRFVYIGPVEPAAAAGDVLIFRGRLFELRRAELVWVGQKPVYC